MASYITLDPDQGFDLCVQSIAHELEFSVRWNETDSSIILEPRQSDTLMELDVFHLHRFPSCRSACGLKHDLVVQPQAQFGHSTQIALQLHGAQDLGAEDIASR